MSDTHHVSIPPELDGERLDLALVRLLPDRTRSFIARCIENELIRIDGHPARRPAERMRSGQSVEIDLPDAAPSDINPQNLALSIVYQDAAIAVIDKPAGLVVHPSAGHADGTLVNALLFHLDDLSGIGGEIRPGIVHRLDKDTSGLIVIAKNDSAHHALTSIWHSGEVVKEYLALVYGAPRQPSGTIEAAIGRDPKDRKRMAVVESGRKAVTHWRLEKGLRYVSLIRCRLQTGRTHQIRVHLKHLGHPIVGDPIYTGAQWRGIPDRRVQKLVGSLDRQALHATRLRFPHPTTGETMDFTSPLPDDLAELVTMLS